MYLDCNSSHWQLFRWVLVFVLTKKKQANVERTWHQPFSLILCGLRWNSKTIECELPIHSNDDCHNATKYTLSTWNQSARSNSHFDSNVKRKSNVIQQQNTYAKSNWIVLKVKFLGVLRKCATLRKNPLRIFPFSMRSFFNKSEFMLCENKRTQVDARVFLFDKFLAEWNMELSELKALWRCIDPQIISEKQQPHKIWRSGGSCFRNSKRTSETQWIVCQHNEWIEAK